MKPIIYPYKMSSQSSKKLADVLGTFRVYPDRNYRPKQDHLVINWGNSHWPTWYNSDVHYLLNHPAHVGVAANKLKTFQAFQRAGIVCPEWTTDYNLVIQWLRENPNLLVYGRRKLTGHSGQGIEICNPSDSWQEGQYSTSSDDLDSFRGCPLYTRQLKYKKEFRVHVFKQEVIDVTQKRRRNGVEANPLIRNLDNGWVFTRENVIVPDCVLEEAKKAVQALGLDFGAVDVAWNETQDKAFIFEVNTACGLEGTTLQRYKEAIENYVSI